MRECMDIANYCEKWQGGIVMERMHLNIELVYINDVCFGEKTEIRDHALVINKGELIEELTDHRFRSIDIELAKPGEPVRIIPVKDAIEPRIKPEKGEFFPGFLGGFDSVGEGTTKVLKGCCVITTGQIVAFQEGLIDMSGPGQAHSIYAHMNNVVLVAEPTDGINPVEHEEAVRLAGIKAAKYLARAAIDIKPDKIEPYVLEDVSEKKLPKILYVNLVLAQGLLHDNYIYGQDAKQLQTMFMHPNEMFDGAIVSGNCVTACDKNTTYDHQNNPVVNELYRRHGVDLEFGGVISSPISTMLKEKERGVMSIVSIARTLGADALVVTEEGGGNPEADIMMIAEKAEKHGIKVVLIVHENAGDDGSSESLTNSSPAADAVVTVGNNNEFIHLPPMERTIGHLSAVNNLAGGTSFALQEDNSIIVRLAVIMGACSNLGITKLSAITY
jgi:sarcosine reductase